MTETNDYITAMRGMYAAARIQFRELAEPMIDSPEMRERVESLVLAIGEISVDEALNALAQYWHDIRETRHD